MRNQIIFFGRRNIKKRPKKVEYIIIIIIIIEKFINLFRYMRNLNYFLWEKKYQKETQKGGIYYYYYYYYYGQLS